MKQVAIDCRYLGMSGIGRVLEGILENLDAFIAKKDISCVFIGNKDKISKFNLEGKIIEDNNSPFSKKGLFISKEVNKCDVFFTPNFIIPLGINIPIYTIVHDMMFLDLKEDTTNGFIDYQIKKYFFRRCAKKSKHIFSVSNFSKNRFLHYYSQCKDKVSVVYNGLSKSIIEYKNKPHKVVKKDYIVFVGNIKKQKGLITLLEAVDNTDIELYIIGNKDNFRTSDNIINNYINKKNIHFTGRLSDDEMYKMIEEAKFLIQPSTYEGFGLPPLEALYLGTKPIISDIEVFKEIYSNYDVEFFKSGNVKELKDKILSQLSEIKSIHFYSFIDTCTLIIRKIYEK